MKIRYSVVRTWVISILALVFVAFLVAMYAVAPTLHRLAEKRTEDYLRARFKSSVQFADFHVSVYPRNSRGH